MKIKIAYLMLVALNPAPNGSAAAFAQRSESARTGGATQYCPRRPIDYFQAAAELSRVHEYCASVPQCSRSGWLNSETKELAGNALSNWLWSGPAPKTFSVAEQNAMITDAMARAQAARPAGKVMRRIDFFYAFTQRQHGGTYAVGVRATYGNCVAGNPRTPS